MEYISRALASIALCAAVAFAAKETDEANCLWALILLLCIW